MYITNLFGEPVGVDKVVQSLLRKESTPFIKNTLLTINKNPKKPLGKLNPWAWWLEITRGCNLSCGFCPTVHFPKGEFHFMTKETWVDLLNLIKVLTPYSRLEFGQAGEPTLHPQLLEFLSLAKTITPHLQLTIITNGTTLINGGVTYKQLFEAGAHMILVDMYAPKEKHIELAKSSGFDFYYKDEKLSKDIPKAWTYHNNPDLKSIILQEPPGNWLNKKIKSGKFHTFLNNLDWEKSKKYGLFPLTTPINRRCDFPSKFISIHYDGAYAFCCNDFMREHAGKIGNVSDGLEGFFKFWLGDYMQYTRKLLHNKDRKSHEYCSRCGQTSVRCDIPYWKEEMFEKSWNGTKWENVR